MRVPIASAALVAGLLVASAALAQPADPSGHDMSKMPGMAAPTPTTAAPQEATPPEAEEGVMTMMPAALGSASMMREASGTAWQPDSAPMIGVMAESGGWSTMIHGALNLVYDSQGGPRGDDKAFVSGMLMAMAQHPLGAGRLTLKAMLSPDPLMGPRGYPLLLQTGETANGTDPLVDRQHPHDGFMELAAVWSLPLDEQSSVFVYAGYPGEPALGPPAFMHRFSGLENPAAPISHHWMDATHITYGVATLGLTRGPWKLEGSLFNGREPDQHRWGWDKLRLNSASARLSLNPSPAWAFQISYGFIKSPEALEPGVDQRRITASAIYNRPLGNRNWQTTLAWGRNDLDPGPSLNAVLLESAVTFGPHTVFARGEIAEKNELFEPPSPLAHRTFTVGTASLGYIYDIPVGRHASLGFGALGSLYALPAAIRPAYGSGPASWMTFVRLKLR